MHTSKNGKLLWDNAKFSSFSSRSPAERLTAVFGEKLLVQAGLPQYPKELPLVVLDNACGSAVVTQSLHEILEDRPMNSFEVICGDVADAMLKAASRRIQSAGWENTKAIKVDAQDTKLPSEHFTHVFTNFGPMLFPDASAMLSECKRMLRAGGVCAFTTWKKVGWIEDTREAVNSTPDLPPFPTDEKIAQAFSRGGWSDQNYVHNQLAQHGFENIKINAETNTSVTENAEELRAILQPVMTIVYKFWTEEEQEKFANEETDKRIEEWFYKKYRGGVVKWDWIALVTTSNKSR